MSEEEISRPEYETEHEQMLAEEREYAMQLQDREAELTRAMAAVTRVGQHIAAVTRDARTDKK